MVSRLGWLDHDTDAQKRTLEVLRTFKEPETRDDLGIATIRDAISEILCPGMSVLQTRLRYMFLLPYLFRQLETDGIPSSKIADEAWNRELELNKRLIEGGEDTIGLFGKSSGDQLKRLASHAYWNGLSRWGILESQYSRDELIQSLPNVNDQTAGNRKNEAGELKAFDRKPIWQPLLPEPSAYAEILGNPSIAMTAEESNFVRDVIFERIENSLFARIGRHEDLMGIAVESDFPWKPAIADRLPTDERDLVLNASHFSTLIQGGLCLLGVALSHLPRHQSHEPAANEHFRKWLEGDYAKRMLNWKPAELFELLRNAGKKFRGEKFVSELHDFFLSIANPAKTQYQSNPALQKGIDLVRERESRKANSRFKDHRTWDGKPFDYIMNYRWNTTRQFLRDFDQGLKLR